MITLRHYGKKIEKLNLESINSQINAASKVIAERSGEGHEFMGWKIGRASCRERV